TDPDAWSLPQVLAGLGIVSPTGDVPHGQISHPVDAASAPSKSTTEREWSAIACRRLFLAALLLWRVRARALASGNGLLPGPAIKLRRAYLFGPCPQERGSTVSPEAD